MWDRFIELQHLFEELFANNADSFVNHQAKYEDCHTNLFFRSNKIELGHISVIDKREDRGMWMMHVAAFSRSEYPMPIFGYDVICGKKKVTGCFHDISPTGRHSKTCEEFSKLTKSYDLGKKRELPEWAKAIFSENMVASGQPNESECVVLAELGGHMLQYWLEELSSLDPTNEYISKHENAKAKYCENQLKNDNSRNVMVALGMDEDYVKKFKRIQFPY